jgi:hypothetical protein
MRSAANASCMLATALVLAAGAYLPNGTYAYVCAQYGRVNEQSSIAVEHRRAGIVVREKTSGSFGEIRSLATDSLVLGGNLEPARYDGVYRVRGRTLRVGVVLTSRLARISDFSPGGRTVSIGLAPQTRHFVVIEPGLMAGLFALPAQLNAWREATVTTVAPNLARAERTFTISRAMLPRPDDVPAADLALTVAGRVAFTIWYDPITFVVDKMVIPERHAVVTRLRQFVYLGTHAWPPPGWLKEASARNLRS